MWETKSQVAEKKRKEAEAYAKQAEEDALTSFAVNPTSKILIDKLERRLALIGGVMRSSAGKPEIVAIAAQYTELEDTIKWLKKKMK